jgi:hypothetical protein
MEPHAQWIRNAPPHIGAHVELLVPDISGGFFGIGLHQPNDDELVQAMASRAEATVVAEPSRPGNNGGDTT